MERSKINYLGKDYAVPRVNKVRDLIPILLEDLNILIKSFTIDDCVVLPSVDHKDYPYLFAESDGHSYKKDGNRFRCAYCFEHVKTDFKCSHSSKCRKEKAKFKTDSMSASFSNIDPISVVSSPSNFLSFQNIKSENDESYRDNAEGKTLSFN